ncbi:MAG: hypothetical protein JST29_05495 [Bacteroidetes bacterium]|nr:hypothetical protein [Bacteroidota bacterium]
MAVRNAYPSLPEVAYQQTVTPKQDIVDYIAQQNITQEVMAAVYMITCNESRSGKAGINNNITGTQADGNKLGNGFDDKVIATTVIAENMTGDQRRFCVFANWQDSVDYLINRVQGRGLYIGGYAHPYANMQINSVADFARAYTKEWVRGDGSAEPKWADEVDFIAGYEKAAAVMFLTKKKFPLQRLK